MALPTWKGGARGRGPANNPTVEPGFPSAADNGKSIPIHVPGSELRHLEGEEDRSHDANRPSQ